MMLKRTAHISHSHTNVSKNDSLIFPSYLSLVGLSLTAHMVAWLSVQKRDLVLQ